MPEGVNQSEEFVVEDDDRKSVTRILQEADGEATREQLLPIVYRELRKLAAAQLAREAPNNSLQPTALVHEAYLRLFGDTDIQWTNRRHFFGAAARSMRQILINRAIQKKTEKHGGKVKRQLIDVDLIAEDPPADWLLSLDEALQQLELIDERKGRIVMLRFFAGLSIEETARTLEISTATVKREWNFARAWLFHQIKEATV